MLQTSMHTISHDEANHTNIRSHKHFFYPSFLPLFLYQVVQRLIEKFKELNNGKK